MQLEGYFALLGVRMVVDCLLLACVHVYDYIPSYMGFGPVCDLWFNPSHAWMIHHLQC